MEALQVQMFGGFAMRYEGKPVLLNKMESSKAVRLLQMLFLAGPKGIAKNEIIDSLYGWDEQMDAVSRNRNLNNVIYRLKGILSSVGLPKGTYVEITDGICRWNDLVPVETDVSRFEEIVKRAKNCISGG